MDVKQLNEFPEQSKQTNDRIDVRDMYGLRTLRVILSGPDNKRSTFAPHLSYRISNCPYFLQTAKTTYSLIRCESVG